LIALHVACLLVARHGLFQASSVRWLCCSWLAGEAFLIAAAGRPLDVRRKDS
jgi:hypothetical protein